MAAQIIILGFMVLVARQCSGMMPEKLQGENKGVVSIEESAPLRYLDDRCELKIYMNGYPVQDTAHAIEGEHVSLVCDALCVGPGLPPVLSWFKLGRERRIPPYRKRVHTSFSRSHRVLTLHIDPVRYRDFTRYTCYGWLGYMTGFVKRHVTLTKGCPGTKLWCDGNRCLDASTRCDGIQQCHDGLDEMNCCSMEEFMCSDGHCFTEDEKCDGTNDCLDGEDEKGCPVCPFKCDESRCLPISSRCDRVPDCDDGMDEFLCACHDNETQCDTGECLSSGVFCDGREDCRDGSDEVNCTCSGIEFTCGNGKCISSTQRCDGASDCLDESDEIGCGCQDTEFTCTDGSCVSADNRCDGVGQCPDSSDEVGCPCQDIEFRCGDGTCLDAFFRCDGNPQCLDHSDEFGCPCFPPDFLCSDGRCISEAVICDGNIDCVNGTDEQECPCSDVEFRCNNGQCLPPSKRCDRVLDCADREDELGCACFPPDVQCSDGLCIAEDAICDGSIDCANGTDEQDCPCSGDEFRCNNGQCLPASKRCDRVFDCVDREDELKCDCDVAPIVSNGRLLTSNYSREYQSMLEYECNPGHRILGTSYILCDVNGQWSPAPICQPKDCGPIPTVANGNTVDGASSSTLYKSNLTYQCDSGFNLVGPAQIVCLETGQWSAKPTCVPKECGADELTCMPGECLPKAARCDRISQCSNGADEVDCDTYCFTDQFKCKDSSGCVDSEDLCNDFPDCDDGSDENSATCGSVLTCTEGRVACEDNSGCAQICDGTRDCDNGWDENNCHGMVLSSALSVEGEEPGSEPNYESTNITDYYYYYY